ncbi:MAG: DUF4011 domain-containing protein, partial [Chloroflexota bacterium]|nr:DUF4011 domain-containing protein [Chloroflexota bacterium]
MPTVEERLSQWQQELLDLSNRNQLLNFRPSTTRPSSLQLIAPQIDELYQVLLQGKSLQVVGHDLLAQNVDPELTSQTAVTANAGSLISPEDDLLPGDATDAVPLAVATKAGTAVSNMPLERANRVALRLLARARASEQEQGINTLFAIFGRLKWQEKPDEKTWRYAPLVLLPVKIEENPREGTYRILATGDDPEFNQTLSQRLRHDFGLTLSVDVDEETDLGNVFAEVRSMVAKQPGWEILEQAHVGHFQFHKLRMFRDLEEHAAIGSQHPIVQALATEGVTISPLPEGVPTEEDLDRAVAPRQSFAVLDADASQLRAIQAAARGANLIIQGPPGTGKSQTIANIIAESIAAEKTVLFVSEKAAAIEVVHRRLTQRGLGDFCLMLHSQKASKRDVVYSLGARLTPDPPPAASPHEDLDLKRLEETRASLNAYAEALHRTRDPLRESAFWAHAELASLHDVPYLACAAPRLDDLTLERLDIWKRLLEQVSRFASIVREGDAHPWAGVRRRDLTLGDQASLRHTLVALQAAVPEIQLASQLLADHLRLPVPGTLQDAQNLARLAGVVPSEGGLRPAWLDPSSIRETEALATEAVGHARAARELADHLFATYGEGILDAATSETLASYERGGLARFFSLAHRRFRAQVRQAARDGQQRPVPDELLALRAAVDLQQQLAWFREREATLADTLGLSLGGSASPDPAAWGHTAMEVSAAAAILARLPSGPVPIGFVEEMCRDGIGGRIRPFQQRLEVAIAKMDRDLENLETFLDVTARQDGSLPLASARFEQLEEWLGQRLSRFDDLDPWLRAQLALRRAKDAGLADVIHQLVVQEVPPDCWTETFRRLILTQWLDAVYREDEVLRAFRGDEHEATIAQFREFDRRYISTSTRRIRRVLAGRQGRVSAAHGGEPGLLRHQAGKRKRHIPLRRLFERIPNLLPTLKPCLMMSPLSVAQFLPADRYRFDIVVFDEASQVRPHDAIGAIMRGKQLIVAGDSKQLPPTAFFDRTADDGTIDDEQDLRALESILDGLGTKGMPSA